MYCMYVYSDSIQYETVTVFMATTYSVCRSGASTATHTKLGMLFFRFCLFVILVVVVPATTLGTASNAVKAHGRGDETRSALPLGLAGCRGDGHAQAAALVVGRGQHRRYAATLAHHTLNLWGKRAVE